MIVSGMGFVEFNYIAEGTAWTTHCHLEARLKKMYSCTSTLPPATS